MSSVADTSADPRSDSPQPERFDLLVLGASFTGVELIHRLRKRSRRGAKLSIALVDHQVRHPYVPLAHERLLGRLDRAASSLETRAYASRMGVRFVHGEIVGFDSQTHTVRLADGRALSGRFVVFALGSEMRAPDLPGAERFLGVKSEAQLQRACEVLDSLLADGGAPGPELIVVGGGISGVELAGELAHAGSGKGESAPIVTLVHGGDRLLPRLCPRAGRLAQSRLLAQGVRVQLGARVESLEPGITRVRDRKGNELEMGCDAAFWAGGVRPVAVLERLGLPLNEHGWLAVAPTLQCYGDADGGDPEIFAAGDAVRVQSGAGQWATMQRAIECIWQADLLARNLLTLVADRGGGSPSDLPPLEPHHLREDFFHGVSLGSSSLLVRGPLAIDLGGLGVWFRRWLMRMYFARYRVD